MGKVNLLDGAHMQDLHFLRLWDLYNGLLTENQREITNLYFNCDLSLAEIAEGKNVTKQSVSDCLNKCKKQLEDYEKKLHFGRTLTENSLTASVQMIDIEKWAERIKARHPKLNREIAELEEILTRDYTAEVQKTIENNEESLQKGE